MTKRKDESPEPDFFLEEPREVHGDEGAGMVQVRIEVGPYRSNKCCMKFDVEISRKLTKRAKPTVIGGGAGFIVEKTIKATPRKNDDLAWIAEMLQRGDMNEHKKERDLTHSVREAVQTLYDTQTGDVEASVHAYRDELTFDRFVFIDTIEVDGPYYNKSCGRQPLRMILEMLPQVLGTGSDGGNATCVLSPARLEQKPDEKTVENDYSDAEVESKLIRFYRNHDGFQIWHQRSAKDEEEPTLMGRTI